MAKRWNERTRLLLTMELAVSLPAIALIGFSLWNLRSIQRDKAVEAAIQRDFAQMLSISEKRINERAHQMTRAVRAEFPCPDDAPAEKLDRILDRYPYAAHAFLYDAQVGWIARSQPRRLSDPDFRKESEELSRWGQWIKMEAPAMVAKLHKMGEKDDLPVTYFSNLPRRGDKFGYQTIAFFTLPKLPKERVALGVLAFDSEYLRDQFFPDALSRALTNPPGQGDEKVHQSNAPVLMIRVRKEAAALATSADWDGGTPEMERNLEGAFPGLTLAIKFRGTTVDELASRFLRTNFLILGGLSLFLVGGIVLTYRNVAREMELARLKSDFVSNVSHELRTPLSLIRLFAETLEMGRLTDPEKYQEYYRIIRKESERLTALINNILDFSRIEAGRKEYSFRETNLAELVRNTLESYRYQIEQMGFACQVNIADDIPPLQVDREAIARSLLNLINNALKYSEREKFLGVNLYRANGTVCLEVIDRGIGIPRSEQGKVFEKFYRAGNPLVHNTKGSGLGLCLVRHIVQAHGGEVTVESAPGKGSRFIIALPLESRTAAAEAV